MANTKLTGIDMATGLSNATKQRADNYVLNGRSARKAGTRADRIKLPKVQEYIQSRSERIQNKLDVTFDWTVNKIRRVVEEGIPDDPNASLQPEWVKLALSGITELNRMLGYHSAEKRINIDLKADVDLGKIKAFIELYKKDY